VVISFPTFSLTSSKYKDIATCGSYRSRMLSVTLHAKTILSCHGITNKKVQKNKINFGGGFLQLS
jgi:hypothetical protein